jgi:hypothetical protein
MTYQAQTEARDGRMQVAAGLYDDLIGSDCRATAPDFAAQTVQII